MSFTIAQKLRIRPAMKILAINPPAGYTAKIRSISERLEVAEKLKDYGQIHWFVLNKYVMEPQLDKVLQLLKNDVICWIYYPKGSSKIQTDLTRDKGWENLLKHDELHWISLISFDEIWSAFGMRLKTAKDEKKPSVSKERPISKYIDPANKTVRLPEDFSLPLKKNKAAYSFFDSLSYTNKKEYLEWIISAKREETRKERIKGALERLEKKWKNPSNR
jgi:hypothetical protein